MQNISTQKSIPEQQDNVVREIETTHSSMNGANLVLNQYLTFVGVGSVKKIK